MAKELLVRRRLRQCLVQTHVVGKESGQLVLLILRHDGDVDMFDVLLLICALDRVSVGCVSEARQSAFVLRVGGKATEI